MGNINAVMKLSHKRLDIGALKQILTIRRDLCAFKWIFDPKTKKVDLHMEPICMVDVVNGVPAPRFDSRETLFRLGVIDKLVQATTEYTDMKIIQEGCSMGSTPETEGKVS